MASWRAHVSGYYKLNVKGMFSRPHMKSTVGCIIRNNSGEFERSCGGMIGLECPITAELLSVFYGLKETWETDKKKLMLECDSQQALNHFMNHDPVFDVADLVSLITNLLTEPWEDIQVYHVEASANAAATVMAAHCLSSCGGVDSFMEPSIVVKTIIEEEM